MSILSKLAAEFGAGGLPPQEGKVAPVDGHDFKEKPDYPAPDKPLNRLIFKDRKTVPDKEVKITKEGSMNEAFLQGLIDGLAKTAESFRSLGVTDPEVRAPLAKSLRTLRGLEQGGSVPKGLAATTKDVGYSAVKRLGSEFYNRLGRGELPKTIGEGKRLARSVESSFDPLKKYLPPGTEVPSRKELFKEIKPEWSKLKQMTPEQRTTLSKKMLGM